MNVLVTGAAGFIGSHVVRELLARGHTVDAVIRPGGSLARLRGVDDQITTWPLDLGDRVHVEATIAELRPEAVVHLAWYAEPTKYLTSTSHNLASLESSVRLLRLFTTAGTARVVLAGSCLENSSVGSSGRTPIYASAKRALHTIAMECADASLSVACAHVFSVFGPWEHQRRAIPSVILALLSGTPVEVTAGDSLRDYLYVSDVATAFVSILESGVTGPIDVCSGNPRQLRSVFEEIGLATGRGDLIQWGRRPVDPGHDFDAAGDASALSDLGWRPSETFPDRVRQTVEWWQSRQATSVQV